MRVSRTETSHQLKRTRFDGVAENNGRIGVQFRGRKRGERKGRWAEEEEEGKRSAAAPPVGEVFRGAGGFGVGG